MATEPTAQPSPQPTQVPAVTPAPTPTPLARLDIEILESGFTYFGGDTPYAQYGVVLENPNPSGWVASYVTVSIAFYDEAGDVLATEEQLVAQAVPGTFAVGGVSFDVEDVKTMEVVVDADWEEVDFATGSYVPSKVKMTQDEYGTRITGILSCDFAEDQEDVEIVAILRDSNKKVIGGESTYVDKVRCEAGTPFEIETLGRMGKAKSANVYPG
jgi:hypothetical protein